jgi:ribosomal protein S18 acetylase RimI-like enzyme
MAPGEIQDSDRAELEAFIAEHWYGPEISTLGKWHTPHLADGFVERRDGKIAGALTYRVDGEGMQILTINSAMESQGIGSSLMLDAAQKARELGCGRIWLTTTNDNLRAVGFYQRLGFRMVGIQLGGVDEMRQRKPRIPECGERGIPIRDEIVMELKLEPYLDA